VAGEQADGGWRRDRPAPPMCLSRPEQPGSTGRRGVGQC